MLDYFNNLRENQRFKVYVSPVLHMALILISFLKILSLLRSNVAFGTLVKLIINCFYEVFYFSLFFVAWVVIFAKLFIIAGAEFDEDDYPFLPLLGFYLQTFRAALGESSPPQYHYWQEMLNSDLDQQLSSKPIWSFPIIMIYTIWIIWFLNLFINMVIMLNFMIAIISQSFETVITNRLMYQYEYKSDLNLERLQFYNVFENLNFGKYLEDFDLMCIVSRQEEDLMKKDEITGLTFKIKQMMK